MRINISEIFYSMTVDPAKRPRGHRLIDRLTKIFLENDAHDKFMQVRNSDFHTRLIESRKRSKNVSNKKLELKDKFINHNA